MIIMLSAFNYYITLTDLQNLNYGMAISILFYYMDHWNTLLLMPKALRNLWPTWPYTSKTKKLKCPSPMTLKTSKILVKQLGILFLSSMSLDRIHWSLIITKIVLDKKSHINSPLGLTQIKMIRKRKLSLTNLLTSKDYHLWFQLNLWKRLTKSQNISNPTNVSRHNCFFSSYHYLAW